MSGVCYIEPSYSTIIYRPMKYLLPAVLVAAVAIACTTQPAMNLTLDWELLTNELSPTPGHSAAFTLTNTGSVDLEPGWELYFSAIYVAQRPVFDSTQVRIEHLSGEWFRLVPVSVTEALKPGESVSFEYASPRFLNANTQFPEGPYLVPAGEGKPITFAAYTTSRIELEDIAVQYQSTNRRVPTAQLLYEQNASLSLLPPESISPIIPTPVSYQRHGGDFILPRQIVIQHDPAFAPEAALFATYLRTHTTLDVSVRDEASATIRVLLDEEIHHSEGYRLKVNEHGVELRASTAAGVHYGFQTLAGLFPINAAVNRNQSVSLPKVSITDYPRFSFRGLFLDISRNYQQKEDILRLIDLMSYYKFNVFQLHLANDEAWRIEIPGLPELTEVASRRGHTTSHRDHLHPSFSSGPDPDNSPLGSGYLTRSDFIEILHYARDRHIQVIPEIVAPGHMRAAIMAMHARYDRFMAEGNAEAAQEFLLEHPEDSSSYLSVQRFRNNTMDVCMESSYRFYTHVLDEIIAMYAEAGVPLETFHAGGDEVPRGVWTGSPACAQLLENHQTLQGTEDLHNYYYTRLHEIFSERGLQLAGWEEVGQQLVQENGRRVNRPNTELLDKNFRLHAWNAVVGWPGTDMAYQLANAGYEVVMSNSSNIYFDLAYDMHPDEPGLHWSGYVNLRSAWQMTPFNHFISNDFDIQGNSVDAAELARTHVALTDEGRSRIIGLQGQLWTETVKGPDMMFYYLLPKMLGLAERAWSPDPSWSTIASDSHRRRLMEQDWNRFANVVGQREFPRFEHLYGGYNARVPRAGAMIKDGVLHANVETPGLQIRYTTDGTEPDMHARLYTGPVSVDGPVTLKVFTPSGKSGGATRLP